MAVFEVGKSCKQVIKESSARAISATDPATDLPLRILAGHALAVAIAGIDAGLASRARRLGVIARHGHVRAEDSARILGGLQQARAPVAAVLLELLRVRAVCAAHAGGQKKAGSG